MADDEVLMRVEGLYRYYDNHCAVDNVSFELRKGEILGFLGPNGAGKSTTMQILTGNLAPSQGRVEIAGYDILDQPRAAKAALGYLPEQPPVYPDLTVDEFLNYCARLNRVPRGDIPGARDNAKARCGLSDVGRRLIGNLSKGYQQRVGIAQAIIHNPQVVILDEPTVGLDPIQIREIRTLITELGRNHSVILSTHILPEVQSTCDRVQIIHRGRLVFADSLSGLTERMRSESLLVRLSAPPRDALLTAIPGVDSVEHRADGSLRLMHEAGAEPAAEVARQAVQNGWGLSELTPERKSLEQIFVELTASDEPAQNGGDAQEAAA